MIAHVIRFGAVSPKGAVLSSIRLFVAVILPVCVFALVDATSETQAQTKDPSTNCTKPRGFAVLTSPRKPWKRAPLRVIIATDTPLDASLKLVTPKGKVALEATERRGGPPYYWFAEIAKPSPGTWRAELSRNDETGPCANITQKISVKSKRPSRPRATKRSVWPITQSWNRSYENLYSAWIEKLFDAPLEEEPSWRALHEVLRDKKRNILHNHLDLREDQRSLIIKPDCADLPYFLRAYFSFKMGLPFGYAKCTRGGGGKAPRCPQWWTIRNEEPPPAPPRQSNAQDDVFGFFQQPPPKPKYRKPKRPRGLVPGFDFYLSKSIANSVHSGGGRTLARDNKTDYYSVPMNEDVLRPGTVYADPYGHLLVIAKRVEQTSDSAGVLYAVDAQPDGTVARKRFWRGNFLFANDPALGGPGFKRFRPVVSSKKRALRRLTNKEIKAHKHYGDFSLEQSKITVEGFYDRMDDLISPKPLDPMRAMLEAVKALEEQVGARVNSVENGRNFQKKNSREVNIPDGYSIFETTGPWEDFATPARDLRLLIAMDVVRKFPARVARRPERFAMPGNKDAAEVEAELTTALNSDLSKREFSYTRTDGSKWTLTLKDVLERIELLEMAYNINDCVEHRWGAPEGSEEAATCRRRASSAQNKKMAQYRTWFQERRRPPRQ